MADGETSGMYGDEKPEQSGEERDVFPPAGQTDQAVENPATTEEIEREKEQDKEQDARS